MLDASKLILLVEDNQDDAVLTLRAFESSHLLNPISVARDGVDAPDSVFARGAPADRAKPLRAEANSYVRRLVDLAEFLEAAKTLGIYWLMRNEVPLEGATL